jgi:uncharacterized membrane protein YqjE
MRPQRRKLLLVMLASDAVVGLINLIIAYREHSVVNAASAVVLWLVIALVFSVWWVRKIERGDRKSE